jgi:GNAT superfamily N-acetyltransferase
MLDNQPVVMFRENLDGLPDFLLPAGYSLSWYQPGDEKWWVDIHLQADQYNPISPELFRQQFGTDAFTLNLRQCYLKEANGKVIGTSTAWYNADFKGQPCGRVHWVAVIPPYQGRGLAKTLLSATCRRLKELGHQKVYLTTSGARTAAINLYLQFGFTIQT